MCIRDRFIQDNYDTSDLQFCSVSGGCLPGVFLSSGLSIQKIWEECFIPWIIDINKLPSKGAILPTFTEKSMAILLKYLKQSITNEDEILKKINTHLSIRMTKLSLFNGGQVYVNKWFAGNHATPFGGYKQSGYSREKGVDALKSYLQVKNVGISLDLSLIHI